MLSSRELIDQLGITAARLNQWIREGCPCQRTGRRRQFDSDAVASWLIETGRASAPEPPETILNTRAECALHFGVTDRTVSCWQDDPAFPGRSGTPGKRDGYYPVRQITEWRSRRDQSGEAATDELAEQIRAERLRQLRLGNDETEGKLVDLEQVRRLVTWTHATAARELQNLPAAILQLLPAGSPQVTLDETRRAVQLAIDRACEHLANTLREYQ